MPSLTDARVESYAGPKKLLRVDGRVAITIRWDGGNEYVPAGWHANALGWGWTVVGSSSSKDALVAYCERRFPGCRIDEE